MHQHHPLKQNSEASVKPMLFALIMISLVIGFFILKTLTADKASTDTITENEGAKEMPTVPLIGIDDIKSTINNPAYQIIDIRLADLFNQAHIESSVNIPPEQLSQNPDGLQTSKKIIIVDQQNSYEGKALTKQLVDKKLSVQYLDGGIQQYVTSGYPIITLPNPNSMQDRSKVNSISAQEFKNKYVYSRALVLLDVRAKDKSNSKTIPGAVNIPLEELERRKNDIPRGTLIVVDENPVRSFQAAVQLFDMNIIGVYQYNDSLQSLFDFIAILKSSNQ